MSSIAPEFNVTNMVNDRALVKGVDKFGTTGSQVICTVQWNELVKRDQHMLAHEAFDDAVEQFFAPIVDAQDALVASAQGKEPDPITYVVLEEAVEGVQGKDEIRVKLNDSSVILRIIENGELDRLIWVNDALEVLT